LFLAGLEAARMLSFPVFVQWQLAAVGHIALLQGNLARARELMDESGWLPFEDLPELQGVPGTALCRAELVEAEGRPDQALAISLHGLEVFGATMLADQVEDLHFDAIRRLVEAGRRDEVRPIRERLGFLAGMLPLGEIFATWADALLTAYPEQRLQNIQEVAAAFEALGRPIDQGRALLDLAAATGESGGDSRPILAEALSLFEHCGAELYARQARTRLGDLIHIETR